MAEKVARDADRGQRCLEFVRDHSQELDPEFFQPTELSCLSFGLASQRCVRPCTGRGASSARCDLRCQVEMFAGVGIGLRRLKIERAPDLAERDERDGEKRKQACPCACYSPRLPGAIGLGILGQDKTGTAFQTDFGVESSIGNSWPCSRPGTVVPQTKA